MTKIDFKKLHKAFCLAFSNNRVELNPSMEEFDYRLHRKQNVNYRISAGKFDGEEMLGFILHSSNVYEGIPTAFNGGTGIIPGFRSQKIGEELYEFLIPKIIQESIARIVLEVVDTNERAIKLYEKIGFYYKRRVLCYKLVKTDDLTYLTDVEEGSLKDIDESFGDYTPPFLDSKNQLEFGEEAILVKKKEGQNVGYIAFQPKQGRISQVAVSRAFRGEGIGKELINGACAKAEKPLTVMNVPDEKIGIQRFLASCGFENQINQFEMELII